MAQRVRRWRAALCGLLDDLALARDGDLDRDAGGLGLLDSLALHVAGADDPEAARAELGIRDDREAADLVPAEAVRLERVHAHLGGRERAVAVVLVDRLGDGLEVLSFRFAHGGDVRTSIPARC